MARNENPASILHPRVDAARRDFLNGRITRREMLFRASIAGAGAMTLAALGGIRAGAQATPEGTPGGTPGSTVALGSTIQVPSDLRTDLGGQSIRAVLADANSTDRPWEEAAIAKFTEATGIKVEFVPGEQNATDRLQNYRQQFAAQSADLDVYQIDVIWPGIIAPFAVDLTEAFSATSGDYIQAIIQNNTVDGKLVAAPWYTDAGLLYYRTDLMEKYGLTVPTTWADLTTTAQAIQDGERATNPNFIGFAWQGKAYEGLTCNGLEWQVANGGGTIVDPDGTVTINNAQAIAAFERAAGWVGTITPQAVVNWEEVDTLNNFVAGNVGIARNWPYMYAASGDAGSAVVGKVGVTGLPAGDGPDARPADTLGGWNMFVSSFSTKQDAAIEFAKYMASAGVQRSFAIERSHTPTITSVYDDPDVAAAQPFISDLRPIFENGAVARPSTATGENYGEVSAVYFQQLNAVLAGSTSASDAVKNMETDIKGIMSGL
jgi:trehalose/maltose transport system substrate-binding protein